MTIIEEVFGKETVLESRYNIDIDNIILGLSQLGRLCYGISHRHGFWEEGRNRNRGEMIALIHSELSEMLEGVRKPGPDHHCPEFTSEEIELADTIIRCADYGEGWSLRLGIAVIAKCLVNEQRPHKHGKAF